MPRRLQWDQLPPTVRRRIERLLGAAVVQVESRESGYSPAFASRCVLANGRRAFVKAVSPAQNPDNPAILQREIDAWSALPDDVPGARLLAGGDEGEWVVAAFEDVEGRMPPPWIPGDLQAVTETVEHVSRITLDPHNPLGTAEEKYRGMFGGWRQLAADHDGLDPWAKEHLDGLVALEDEWAVAVTGDQLVHGDLRGDNILFASDGRVVFVDWTDACRGNSLFDLVAMVPSLVLDGCGAAETVLADSPQMRTVDPRILAVMVAAISGYFLSRAKQPSPPGLPTLRAFQAAQGRVCLEWLPSLLAAL